MKIAITNGSTASIAKINLPKNSKDQITPASHIRARRFEKSARRVVAADDGFHSDSKPAYYFHSVELRFLFK